MAIKAVRAAGERLHDSTSRREVLVWEAKAASVYWRAWASLTVTFARAELGKTPEHWRTFGDRHSPLTSSPRLATAPAGAILNYLYALAESECRLALLAFGLDPGLGWAHRDAPYRNSAALDLLEPVRPAVDRYVVKLLAERTFSWREFVELPSGQVRLSPILAKSLAESTLLSWEKEVATVAEEVARRLAAGATSPVRVPSRRGRGGAGTGRGTLGRRSPERSARPKPVVSACRDCGAVLDQDDRVYCDECLPKFESERTAKLLRSARKVLAEMRGSANDPAQTPEAKGKRQSSVKARIEVRRVWELEHGSKYDRQVFAREILPRLTEATLPQMMRATGLTSGYCWKIKKGQRVPHPMYWAVLRALADGYR
jgi:hypothetical protein